MALDWSDVVDLVAKLLRAMPRNPDVVALDEAIRRKLTAGLTPSLTASNTLDQSNKPFDRKRYMRDYMRKKRAAGAKA